MSIKDIVEKIKPHIRQLYKLILIVVIASIFFALGRISALEERKTPIKIIYPNTNQTGSVIDSVSSNSNLGESATNAVSTSNVSDGGQVIGSKSGKKYYFPWCGTVKMIKPENQVKFASIAEAKKAGFVPGGNCKGLK
jgi:hypothetical protein